MEVFFVSNCVIETMTTHWNEMIILLMTRLLAFADIHCWIRIYVIFHCAAFWRRDSLTDRHSFWSKNFHCLRMRRLCERVPYGGMPLSMIIAAAEEEAGAERYLGVSLSGHMPYYLAAILYSQAPCIWNGQNPDQYFPTKVQEPEIIDLRKDSRKTQVPMIRK